MSLFKSSREDQQVLRSVLDKIEAAKINVAAVIKGENAADNADAVERLRALEAVLDRAIAAACSEITGPSEDPAGNG